MLITNIFVTLLINNNNMLLSGNLGWNDSAGDKYSRLVRDAVARARFITRIIEFIEKHNFDGLDLDWEVRKIFFSGIFQKYFITVFFSIFSSIFSCHIVPR